MKKIYPIIIVIALIFGALLIIFLYDKPEINITGQVVSVVTPDYIELKWQRQSNYEILNQQVAVAKECISDGNDTSCDWLYYEPLEPNALNYRDYEIHGNENTLKFYQIFSKVRFGGNGTSCRPQCMFRQECSPPHYCEDEDYAWYDVCTGEMIKVAACFIEQQSYCCFQGTDEQGWYGVDFNSPLTTDVDPLNHLIKYDSDCDDAVRICTEKTDVFVKFTQPFTGHGSSDTSVNWLVVMQDTLVAPEMLETGIGAAPVTILGSAEDLLETRAIDYLAYWDSSKQYYYGAAFGQEPKGMKLVTGTFMLLQYHPYFTGAKRDGKMTWVGKMPEHQSFKLKYVTEYLGEPTENKNFIVLPLDTRIKTASQLCNQNFSNLPLDQDKAIYEWNPETQQEMPAGTGEICANIINNDFVLEPGKVYKVHVTQDIEWEQI